MNAKKLFYALICLAITLTIATFGVLYFANSFLKKRSEKLNQLKIENASVEESERVYTKAKNDLLKYRDLEQAVNDALPKEKNQAKALKEIIQIANDTNIKIEKIEFTDSTLGQKKTSSASSTASTTTTTNPSTTSQSNNQITQAKPIAGISGVLGVEIKITLTGNVENTPINYGNFINFLDKVSYNRRSMQITNLDIQPGLKKIQITLNIFVKP